jgi:hypothetical protein
MKFNVASKSWKKGGKICLEEMAQALMGKGQELAEDYRAWRGQNRRKPPRGRPQWELCLS